MIRRSFFGISATAVAGVTLLGGNAMGQQNPYTEQLVGTWSLISHEASRPDGSKGLPYGANPKGIAVFDAGGHFIISVMRSDRPKYAKELPWLGSPEENKATAEGTMTYFGTYSVSETDRTISIHIAASSFPNWNGKDQKRGFVITGDQLTLTVSALQTGGAAEVIWKRTK
jgi:hypothetical protein